MAAALEKVVWTARVATAAMGPQAAMAEAELVAAAAAAWVVRGEVVALQEAAEAALAAT